MKGFLIGLILIVLLILSALSIRPGGLRNQLRNVARRLRLALILGGVYLVTSTTIRLAFSDTTGSQIAVVAIGVALALAFLALGQDQQLDRR